VGLHTPFCCSYALASFAYVGFRKISHFVLALQICNLLSSVELRVGATEA
jgi:hypothetical protein